MKQLKDYVLSEPLLFSTITFFQSNSGFAPALRMKDAGR